MHEIDETNSSFLRQGWTIVKRIKALQEGCLSEDMACFNRGLITVDFGFYGDGTNPKKGSFGIYLIENDDWENHLEFIRVKDFHIAVSILKCLSELDFRSQ